MCKLRFKSWPPSQKIRPTLVGTVFVSRSGPRYSEDEARKAIAGSRSWAEALRRLGMCQSGGGGRVLRKYAAAWRIPTGHFDPYARLEGRIVGYRSMRSWLRARRTHART